MAQILTPEEIAFLLKDNALTETKPETFEQALDYLAALHARREALREAGEEPNILAAIRHYERAVNYGPNAFKAQEVYRELGALEKNQVSDVYFSVGPDGQVDEALLETSLYAHKDNLLAAETLVREALIGGVDIRPDDPRLEAAAFNFPGKIGDAAWQIMLRADKARAASAQGPEKVEPEAPAAEEQAPAAARAPKAPSGDFGLHGPADAIAFLYNNAKSAQRLELEGRKTNIAKALSALGVVIEFADDFGTSSLTPDLLERLQKLADQKITRVGFTSKMSSFSRLSAIVALLEAKLNRAYDLMIPLSADRELARQYKDDKRMPLVKETYDSFIDARAQETVGAKVEPQAKQAPAAQKSALEESLAFVAALKARREELRKDGAPGTLAAALRIYESGFEGRMKLPAQAEDTFQVLRSLYDLGVREIAVPTTKDGAIDGAEMFALAKARYEEVTEAYRPLTQLSPDDPRLVGIPKNHIICARNEMDRANKIPETILAAHTCNAIKKSLETLFEEQEVPPETLEKEALKISREIAQKCLALPDEAVKKTTSVSLTEKETEARQVLTERFALAFGKAAEDVEHQANLAVNDPVKEVLLNKVEVIRSLGQSVGENSVFIAEIARHLTDGAPEVPINPADRPVKDPSVFRRAVNAIKGLGRFRPRPRPSVWGYPHGPVPTV